MQILPSLKYSKYNHQLLNSGEEYLISPQLESFPKFSNPLNIGILASGKGTNFEALVKAIKYSDLNINISLLIVNNSKCEALVKAHRYNIPSIVLNHLDYSSREDFDRNIIKEFMKYKVEGLVMAGWMRIVTPILINAFPDRIINIHPSLLPSFPGMNAVAQAIEAGVNISGCSVHIVTPKVDTGPVLIQAAVPVLNSDNIKSLSKRIQVQEHFILPLGLLIAAQRWRTSDS